MIAALAVDVGRIFPEQWERFASHIPPALRGMRIVDAYATQPCLVRCGIRAESPI
jgi:hypothetical protein